MGCCPRSVIGRVFNAPPGTLMELFVGITAIMIRISVEQ